jgi:hypothetical protein
VLIFPVTHFPFLFNKKKNKTKKHQQAHKFFKGLDWVALEKRQVRPPFLPAGGAVRGFIIFILYIFY